jgi:hypothetical protein
MTDTSRVMALPKWPQMLVYGNHVKFDQMTDIIRRTDRLFGPGRNGDSYGGSRFKKFEKALCRGMGLPWGGGQYSHDGTDDSIARMMKRSARVEKAWQKFRDKVGYVETTYVHNDWLASCFYAGGYGWCNPSGNIFFGDNIGKWPSPEEVLSDWSKLAEAFPYLVLDVALMTGEECEENTTQACAITVDRGKATLHGQDYETFRRFGSSIEEMKVYNVGFSAGRSAACGDGVTFTAEQALRLLVPDWVREQKARRRKKALAT